MEDTIKILIYIHAFFGGMGLITGIGSIIVKKGSTPHKLFGKLFSVGMICSSLISLPISCMPNHENLFLFLIGLFTIYLVISGRRALKFKTNQKADYLDKILSISMLVFSLIMIFIGVYGLFGQITNSILFLFFGAFGLLLSVNDMRFYKHPKKAKNGWLRSHIGKMIGALIASFTAFIIAGLGISNIVSWTLPTLLGTVYILYWKRKLMK
ncbi:hypothetical protein ACFFU1_12600 [Algibacter miyuki]|uniref:DUF2306 domain-containing protein n=1 Tax=Algibacter miyuki TaxID=1306933 RepID=A0ABV5H220_9FLAO|nr:hypothetical protein [Algibacter miyuki]MDN3666356.1 hypothetical protein [Algibacter miyuki]